MPGPITIAIDPERQILTLSCTACDLTRQQSWQEVLGGPQTSLEATWACIDALERMGCCHVDQWREKQRAARN